MIMDSLKTLMDKKQYDLVIKLTENSHDSLSLFYRISALLAVGQSEPALETIKKNQKVLQEKLAILIKIHIEILCLLGRFDEAYNELHYYQELPYESQEVEEILNAMPNYIRKEEREKYRSHSNSEEELTTKLMSKNDDEVLAALDEIKHQRVDDYLLPLLKIIRSYPKQVVRTFALLLLVNQKYDKEVDFLHFDKLIKVVPNTLKQPFVVEGFNTLNDLSFELQSLYHDPSLVMNAMQIISSYLLYIYPNKLELSKDEVLVIFGFIAKRLLQAKEDDFASICEQKGLNPDKISQKINEINEDLKNF